MKTQTCLVLTLRRFLSIIPFTNKIGINFLCEVRLRHPLLHLTRKVTWCIFKWWLNLNLSSTFEYCLSFVLLHRVYGWSTFTLCFHSYIRMRLTQDHKKPRLSERPTLPPAPGIFKKNWRVPFHTRRVNIFQCIKISEVFHLCRLTIIPNPSFCCRRCVATVVLTWNISIRIFSF